MRLAGLALVALLAIVVAAACAGDGASTSDPTTTTAPAPATTAQQPTTLPLATLPPGADVCDGYRDIADIGALADPDLDEVSGIAASRRHSGIIWAHNDSLNGARLYGLSEDGELVARLEIDGAGALDWEDISIGPGPEPGVDYLYIGDIGDNLSIRPNITVYRFPEPDLALDGTIQQFDRIRLAYPEPGHDAEAIAVDPVTGDLIVITKDRRGPEIVFVARASDLREGPAVPLVEIARLDLDGRSEVTAADFSPAGERLALRGYNRVWMWPRIGLDLAETLAADPCRAASPDEIQGESLAFATDGLSFYTISEGVGATVHRVGTVG